jgi:hypothetical protein
LQDLAKVVDVPAHGPEARVQDFAFVADRGHFHRDEAEEGPASGFGSAFESEFLHVGSAGEEPAREEDDKASDAEDGGDVVSVGARRAEEDEAADFVEERIEENTAPKEFETDLWKTQRR